MSGNRHSFAEAVKICIPFATAIKKQWEHDLKPDFTREDSSAHQTTEQPLAHSHARISCHKGCGACCHYPLISSSSIEAFVLLAGWLSGGHSITEIHNRCMDYTERFRRAAEKIGHLPFSHAARRAFMREDLPCPAFQSTPNSPSKRSGYCGVYKERPVICSQFHSTSAPELCAEIQPHGTIPEVMEAGEMAALALRQYEHLHFGKSALGHLPLLLAALTTEDGLNAFLRVDKPADSNTEEAMAQDLRDFLFYTELLSCIGIELNERDLVDLEKAQNEF
jgi:Fe-S-cluster containining protein